MESQKRERKGKEKEKGEGEKRDRQRVACERSLDCQADARFTE